MTRPRYGFHEYHPSRERLLRDVLNGDHDRTQETLEQTRIIEGWIVAIEADLHGRKRHRKLPGEDESRRSQKRIRFKRRA